MKSDIVIPDFIVWTVRWLISLAMKFYIIAIKACPVSNNAYQVSPYATTKPRLITTNHHQNADIIFH